MKKLTAEETLVGMVEMLTENLTELAACGLTSEFIYGERTAYVECLEWLQKWQDSKIYGLDYDVEKRFPL